MGNNAWNDKNKFIWLLSVLLLVAFLVTSGISYKVAHDSLSQQIESNTLPLTSDNIYSEIQQDLLRPIFISSLMAQDTFVRDWTLSHEQEPEKLIRYLKEIQEKYDTVTSFFVSEKSRNYYHSTGILKQIQDVEPDDAWYFRVRSLPESEHYEVNIDADTADRSKTTVFVNYKVFDFEGKFIGVTGVGLAVEKVKSLIELYQKRYNRRVFFTDRQGNVTLHGDEYDGADSLQTSLGLENLATRILTSPSAAFSYQRNGKTVYLNSRLVPEFKWYLIVEQEDAPQERELLNTFWGNLALSLMVTLGILFISNMTLGRYQRKLEVMASTDKLTGAANRQVFDGYFRQALDKAKLTQSPISILLLDIDHFKKVNDSYGHGIGDLVLKTMTNMLRSALQQQDILCRWGGEEFLILLPGMDLTQAAELAEQIRELIFQREIKVNGLHISITVSIGVAEHQAQEPAEDLIKRADLALYQAKEAGRNQVVLNHS
ncbi:MAG: sensor domain-containing diguanylate cyclase [Gammaproteobacteria bacterium]|uniref:diguanylate cyclase n=1 Tax=Shewanella vaxholmensis TaxID=3063535 RepID=A0ABU9USK3_9GAMM|nr:sensor domain-containing diguanylate cyclase [Shewanella sp. Pdp11]MBU1393608.1 sensor domain-containing diguanylate cyclase [Gammaproteobacteria bacterium]AUD58205.1 diguanylate cyclase [Shewanella sp. Pdp11]MBU1477239.1 sensor domain-containing diguanylate cyclase [Gammaproteobacteria bacterium]MBU2001004.1 sensor domain-containing diguanylate cyclase [Gammaproteobacteria bacterium]MBU2131948.1 sensor domain-containing diguanylate cyclase [Gammaproteobacteria bacterium]